MFLSEDAKRLLEENSIPILQDLPLEYLISESGYAELQSANERPIKAVVDPMASATPDLTDAVSFSSLEDPVVVSSGRIYSKATVDHIFASAQASISTSGLRQVPLCPLTRVELTQNCYGHEGAKTSYVRLPQIAAAVAEFKQRLKVERTIETLSAPDIESKTLQLALQVNRHKLRVVITQSDTDSTRTPPTILTNFMKASFPDSRSEVVTTTATTQGYGVTGYGRCWQAQTGEVRIDFWHPLDTLTDDEINLAITALLTPLALAAGEIPAGAIYGSVRHLGPREYKIATTPMALPLTQIAKCCDSFIQFTKKLITERGETPNDVVEIYTTSTSAATHTGAMLFGARTAPTSGAAGASSAPPPSAPFFASVAPPSAPNMFASSAPHMLTSSAPPHMLTSSAPPHMLTSSAPHMLTSWGPRG